LRLSQAAQILQEESTQDAEQVLDAQAESNEQGLGSQDAQP
jgi:hypothetical protein